MHEFANEHMMEHILANNEELPNHNREHLDERNAWTVNIMSAPGNRQNQSIGSDLVAT